MNDIVVRAKGLRRQFGNGQGTVVAIVEATFEIRRGDRIAQLVIQRVEHASFSPAAALADSDRGTGGFGHTGR